MVGTKRLELLHLAALEPKSSASTNFATSPVLFGSKAYIAFDVGYYSVFFIFGKCFFIKKAKKTIKNQKIKTQTDKAWVFCDFKAD